MSEILLQHSGNAPEAINIQLPTSKSIANRALIIRALSNIDFKIHKLSDSDDTQVLLDALNNTTENINIGHAGTSMRFLTAYFATQNRNITLSGSERMHERPIGVLVDALNQLGANITYAENQGFPPLHIQQGKLNKNSIDISGDISSQYISALLLIAPTLPNGLTIRIKGKLVSLPYVEMTLEIMKQFEIQYHWSNSEITIPHQTYKPKDFTVEADWSAASYWFSILLVSDIEEIRLHGLQPHSTQGDSRIAEIYQKFGIKSYWQGDLLILNKEHKAISNIVIDFTETPDLAQTLVVSCVLTKTAFHFTGLETLKIKETNRIEALINECSKLGAFLYEPAHGQLYWDGKFTTAQEIISISTYKDHRMAMAFAPVAFLKNITIENSEVVSKSYPNFWEDLKKTNIIIENT